MSSAAANDSDNKRVPSEKPNKSTVVLLFTIAADTTWRMFIPIIGGTIVGVWADNTMASKPAWSIVGIAVGVVIATVLVRQQMKKKV